MEVEFKVGVIDLLVCAGAFFLSLVTMSFFWLVFAICLAFISIVDPLRNTGERR